MENNTIIDLILIDPGKPLSDILAIIGFPPEPTALLERVEGRMSDPDIAGLVAVIQDQVRALKASEAAVDQLFTHLAAQARAEAVAGDEGEEEEAAAVLETGMELEFDESISAALVERMKPRLDDPGIKELVLALELQTLSLKRANKIIAELVKE
jgi:hypothetical protein